MQHGRMRLQVNAHQDTLARDVHIGDRILVEVHGYCDDAIGIQPARGQEVVPSLRQATFSWLLGFATPRVFRRSVPKSELYPPPPPRRGAFVRGGERGDPGKPGHAAHTHSRIVNAPGAGGGARSTCVYAQSGNDGRRERTVPWRALRLPHDHALPHAHAPSLRPSPLSTPMPSLSAHAPLSTPIPSLSAHPLSLRPCPLSTPRWSARPRSPP